MYCEQCGKWNEDGRKHCTYCGTRMRPIQDAVREKDEKSSDRENDQFIEAKAELEELEKELHRLNRKKRPVFALFSALLVLAAVLALLISQVLKLYGPKHAAEEFMTAMLSGSWKEAYASLYMEGETSPFLTEEMFVKVRSRTGSSGFSELKLSETESTKERKTYSAEYETSEGTRKVSVIMRRTGAKKLKVLSEWKVDPGTVTVQNISITIPSEAKLQLNGLAPETEGTLNEEAHAVEYSFPSLFAGIWEAELSAENRAPYTEDVEVKADHADGVISLAGVQLYPDQELMDSILAQFAEDYQAILRASLNRADFSEVEQYFASASIQEGRAQNLYANACSQAFDPETGSGILSYELSDISAKFVSTVKSGYAEQGDLVMEIQSTMQYTYMNGEEEMSDVQTSTGLLCYHQEDGQWKIQSFS